ncbi:SRPBCC family protein [Methylophilus luteus]|uniref:SRPBCC domain-containing protein n=1 Tax=Methylophilus luteus TaxID=640108 RepID=A0ABW3F3K9_9PROT
MADIIHRVGIKAPIAKVYAAIATVEGVAAWWSKQATGVSTPGGAIELVFKTVAGESVGVIKFEVMTLQPDKQVIWRFISGPQEWLTTHASFDLIQDGDYTIVLFGHRDWSEPGEFMAHCNMKWGTFLMSLKMLVESGQGRPSPDDVKIDNWN